MLKSFATSAVTSAVMLSGVVAAADSIWTPQGDDAAAFADVFDELQPTGTKSLEYDHITWTESDGQKRSLRTDCAAIITTLDALKSGAVDDGKKSVVDDILATYTFLCAPYKDVETNEFPPAYANFEAIVGTGSNYQGSVDAAKLDVAYPAADNPDPPHPDLDPWAVSLTQFEWDDADAGSKSLSTGQVTAFVADMEGINTAFTISGKDVESFQKSSSHSGKGSNTDILGFLKAAETKAVQLASNFLDNDSRWYRAAARHHHDYDHAFDTWYAKRTDTHLTQAVSLTSEKPQPMNVFDFCLRLKMVFQETLELLDSRMPPVGTTGDYAKKLRDAVRDKKRAVEDAWASTVPVCQAADAYFQAVMSGNGQKGNYNWLFDLFNNDNHAAGPRWLLNPTMWYDSSDSNNHHLIDHVKTFEPNQETAFTINQALLVRNAAALATGSSHDGAHALGNMMWAMFPPGTNEPEGAPAEGAPISVNDFLLRVKARDPNKHNWTTWVYEVHNKADTGKWEKQRALLPARFAQFHGLLYAASNALTDTVSFVEHQPQAKQDHIFQTTFDDNNTALAALLSDNWPDGTVTWFPAATAKGVMDTAAGGDTEKWQDDLKNRVGPRSLTEREAAETAHTRCRAATRTLEQLELDIAKYQLLLHDTPAAGLDESLEEARGHLLAAQQAYQAAMDLMLNHADPATSACYLVQEVDQIPSYVQPDGEVKHPLVFNTYLLTTKATSEEGPVVDPKAPVDKTWMMIHFPLIQSKYPTEVPADKPQPTEGAVPTWLSDFIENPPDGFFKEGDQRPTVAQLQMYFTDMMNGLQNPYLAGIKAVTDAEGFSTWDEYFKPLNAQIDAINAAKSKFATDVRMPVPNDDPSLQVAAAVTGKTLSPVLPKDLPTDFTGAEGVDTKMQTKFQKLLADNTKLFIDSTQEGSSYTQYYLAAPTSSKNVDDYAAAVALKTTFTDAFVPQNLADIRAALVAEYGEKAVGGSNDILGTGVDNYQIWQPSPAPPLRQHQVFLSAAVSTTENVMVYLYLPKLGNVAGVKDAAPPTQGGCNTGVVIAIIVGSVAFGCLLIGLIACFCCKKQEQQDGEDQSSSDEEQL